MQQTSQIPPRYDRGKRAEKLPNDVGGGVTGVISGFAAGVVIDQRHEVPDVAVAGRIRR